MTRNRAAFIAATTLLSCLSFWQTVVVAAPPTDDKPGAPNAAPTTTDKPKAPPIRKPKQAAVASKTAKFVTISAAAPEVKNAVDAHNLAKAATLVQKPIVFVGTVAKIYGPTSNELVILNFDKDYKSALTAVVFADNFSKFPDMSTLEGKMVLVVGEGKMFHKAVEVILKKPDQIKIVQ